MQITSIYKDTGSREQSNHILTPKQEKKVLGIYRPSEVVHFDLYGNFVYNLEIMIYSALLPMDMHVWFSHRINNQEPNTILRNVSITALCRDSDGYYQKEGIGFLHTVARAHDQSIEVKLSDTIYELG